ncbi:hypothetical protein K461DRAFT_275011 [Myriangium duriaei CBS 260.36]|uniref:PAC domain-containing protein n=1 Tax=Myriangium duriaei CBS 260.36 TaxID=1168546 RepID=A0A9P4JBH7_9PEZI|nr:hypothetical protein K461DRAFT_275011 [Myriangium duriaei CBS 260.36]
MSYCVGRNCRFLQGPRTNKDSVRRIAEACRAGKEHSEVFLNYRRDGQPFMNLLMIAPLHDSQGVVRYFIGAQVDVSGLVKDSTDLEGMRRLVAREADPVVADEQDAAARKEEFQSLSEMFNNYELGTIRKHGGRMHQPQVEESDDDAASIISSRPRLVLTDPTADELDRSTAAMPKTAAEVVKASIRDSGRLQGVYQHYLLVRPAPSLRILFTSPSLRIPGILQTPFLSRVGGSSRVRAELEAAFTEGRSVTAKIRWLTRPDADPEDADGAEGRSRWIHCTPLLNHKGAVGVWMVVLVDAETHEGDGRKRFRAPPSIPVNDTIFSGNRVNSKSSRHSEASSSALGEKERPVLNRKTSASSRLTIGGSPVVNGSMSTYISGGRSRPASPLTSPLTSPTSDTFRRNVNHVTFDERTNKF